MQTVIYVTWSMMRTHSRISLACNAHGCMPAPTTAEPGHLVQGMAADHQQALRDVKRSAEERASELKSHARRELDAVKAELAAAQTKSDAGLKVRPAGFSGAWVRSWHGLPHRAMRAACLPRRHLPVLTGLHLVGRRRQLHCTGLCGKPRTRPRRSWRLLPGKPRERVTSCNLSLRTQQLPMKPCKR